MVFSDVIKVIKKLSKGEKREIQLLLQQYHREERRDEIYANFEVAHAEQQNSELTFSSDISQLRQFIDG